MSIAMFWFILHILAFGNRIPFTRLYMYFKILFCDFSHVGPLYLWGANPPTGNVCFGADLGTVTSLFNTQPMSFTLFDFLNVSI